MLRELFLLALSGRVKEKAIDEEQIKEICKKMKPILYKRIWNEVIEDEI